MNPLKFPFDFLQFAGHLKFVKRAGWLRFAKIKSVESVSDHSYRMALISCLCLPDFNIDINKCLRMSLVHDLAESVVGDITPHDGISKEEKQNKEEEAMIRISSTLNKEMGELLVGLWREYEEGVSEEAKIVKDLDKYEMLLQAYEYEEKYKEDLGEFFKSLPMIKNPIIREWAENLMDKRNHLQVDKEKI